MELLEQLKLMNLLVDNYYYELELNWPKEEIAPGVEIFHEELAVYVYCLRLSGSKKDSVTIEDIAKLYEAYDEELEKKFLSLYGWYTNNGSTLCHCYERAIQKAYVLYFEQYGQPFNGKTPYIEMLAEDKIALEQFVRDNPGLMPKEVYYEELRFMHISSF